MPSVQVYIRSANWEAWNKIEDKSAWVNERLMGDLEGGMIGLTPAHIKKYGGASDTSTGKPIKTPKIEFNGADLSETVTVSRTPEAEGLTELGKKVHKENLAYQNKLCEHGAAPKFCKVSKCKNYFGRVK